MMDDLEQLKNEVTFASTKIYLAFDMTSWRPSYYVVEDDHMIEQHHKEICRYVSGTKLVNGKWRRSIQNATRGWKARSVSASLFAGSAPELRCHQALCEFSLGLGSRASWREKS